MRRNTVFGTMVLGLLASSNAWAGITISPGWDSNAVSVMQTRFRDLGPGTSAEVYHGVPPLGQYGGDYNQIEMGYSDDYDLHNSFVLTYDPNADSFTVDLDVQSSNWTSVFGNVSTRVSDASLLSKMNYIQITVSDRVAGSSVTLNNLVVEGTSLGNVSVNPNDGWNDWTVSGANLGDGFTITGDIDLTGLSGMTSSEANKVQLSVGYVPVVPAPGAFLLVPVGLAFAGWLRRRFA